MTQAETKGLSQKLKIEKFIVKFALCNFVHPS